MNTDLFIGGLPSNMDDEGLKKLLEIYGKVLSARVIIDRTTGRKV